MATKKLTNGNKTKAVAIAMRRGCWIRMPGRARYSGRIPDRSAFPMASI